MAGHAAVTPGHALGHTLQAPPIVALHRADIPRMCERTRRCLGAKHWRHGVTVGRPHQRERTRHALRDESTILADEIRRRSPPGRALRPADGPRRGSDATPHVFHISSGWRCHTPSRVARGLVPNAFIATQNPDWLVALFAVVVALVAGWRRNTGLQRCRVPHHRHSQAWGRNAPRTSAIHPLPMVACDASISGGKPRPALQLTVATRRHPGTALQRPAVLHYGRVHALCRIALRLAPIAAQANRLRGWGEPLLTDNRTRCSGGHASTRVRRNSVQNFWRSSAKPRGTNGGSPGTVDADEIPLRQKSLLAPKATSPPR
mmetsp:Transcript_119103/g.273129  ORF Transcript_119103/g.273129 Transcript_119103/m.273129 type:complete len:318 (-) Transcript_119103:3895-4848(-)